MRRYADARETVPQPSVVAGVLLRPFCLGHHLLFKSLGLPFAGNPDADCGPEDLMLGIAVCGMRYQDTVDAIHGGTWGEVIERWRKSVAGPWYKPKQLDMVEVERLFREHLRDGYTIPPLWSHDDGKIVMSAPWELLLKVRLVSSGFSEDEVLNGYLPGRWYEYFAALELAASAKCEDPKQWRKLFFTRDDAERMEACQ